MSLVTKQIFLVTFYSALSFALSAAEKSWPELDIEALRLEKDYQEIVKMTQKERDHALCRIQAAPWGDENYRIKRKKLAQALLAGANPNLDQHTHKDHRNIIDYPIADAIQWHDISLIQLLFEHKQLTTTWNIWKYDSRCHGPWISCRSIATAELLMRHEVPLYSKKHQISALHAATFMIAPIPYIKFLLKNCPEAACVTLGTQYPLHSASGLEQDRITGGTKEELLKLLIDYGANPHYQVPGWHVESRHNAVNYLTERNGQALATSITEYYKDHHLLRYAVAFINRFKVLSTTYGGSFTADIANRIAQYTVFNEQVTLSLPVNNQEERALDLEIAQAKIKPWYDKEKFRHYFNKVSTLKQAQ